MTIYLALMLPPGSSDQPGDKDGHLLSLYLVLLQMGFTQPAGHPAAGELLPHHFTLTRTGSHRLKASRWRYVSVALSVGSPLLGVTQHPARRVRTFLPSETGGHPVYLTHLYSSIDDIISQQAGYKPQFEGSKQ